ncbi:IS3 family transposase [Hymenobacter sp. BT188]|uniref:IS3 family transposase n=1 Tax=Hymenobacter sp. BT188 TaxID=2763504 RepID=UPI003966F805
MPAWQVAVRQLFVQHVRRYGTRRLRAELAAQGHTGIGRRRIQRVLVGPTACGRSSPVRLFPAPPTLTRRCAPRPTGCWGNHLPRPPTRCG